MFAAFVLPFERCIEATTLTPLANISPRPVVSIKKGAIIFTAAKEFAPAPLPTKIPSATLMVEERNIPSKVGINILENKTEIFSFLKSILSICIMFYHLFVLFF